MTSPKLPGDAGAKSQAQPDDVSPFRPARLLRRSKGLHRFFYNRLGLPLSATQSAIRLAKRGWNSREYRERVDLAAQLPYSGDAECLKNRGYLELAPGILSALPDVIGSCQDLYNRTRMSGDLTAVRSASAKDFLISLIRNKQALQHPEIMAVAVSPQLLELASSYFGSVPVLTGIRLWWSPPNTTARQSQLVHADREDRMQLKLLINITETTPSSGPFTLFPADTSANIKSALKYSPRQYLLSDDDVSRVASFDDCVSLTGPAGSSFCVDTSRCLHYGSRCNDSDRLVLMFQYTHCLAPNVTMPIWLRYGAVAGLRPDELQLLALGLTDA